MAPFFIDVIRNQLTSLPYPTQSFAGQTVIVTGSNTGLGFEAAQHLVRLNAAKVILAVRSIPKGEDAAQAIASSTGKTDVCEVWQLDMASYDSIQDFVKRAEGLERIDVALLNASISKTSFEETNGTESSIAVNVYGTFLLALGLLPLLRRSGQIAGKPPRLTVVTSDAHFLASFNERKQPQIFKALSDPAASYMWDRYPTTKLLQILVIRSLAREMSQGSHASEKVILNHVNPGMCHSDLFRDTALIQYVLTRPLFWTLARTAEVGSRNYIAAISASEESHGKWFSECVLREPSQFVSSSEGVSTQERVWEELKEILEGIQPGILKNI